MIVISSSFVLSASSSEAALPTGTPWIGWHNIVVAANLSSTTADADLPVTNLANPLTHLLWQGGINASDEYVTLTTNYSDDLDYVAVAHHNFGSNGNIVSIEGDDGNSPSGFTELVQEQLLGDDSPVIFRFTPQPLTSIRLRIQPGTDAPFAAVMYVGKLLVMERSIDLQDDHVPMKYGRASKIVSGVSESGNFLGRIVTQHTRESKAEFAHITPSWYRSNLDPFIVVSRTTPFFYAWYPTEYPLEAGFAWMMNQPVPATNPVTLRIQIEFQMRGVA